jgi:hypothetical protein
VKETLKKNSCGLRITLQSSGAEEVAWSVLISRA